MRPTIPSCPRREVAPDPARSNGRPPSPTAGWAHHCRVDAPWAGSPSTMRPGGRARIDRCGAACGGRDCDRSIDEFRWLDATEVAGLISAGSVSVEEVLEASLARVEALNPSLNTVIAPISTKHAATHPWPSSRDRSVACRSWSRISCARSPVYRCRAGTPRSIQSARLTRLRDEQRLVVHVTTSGPARQRRDVVGH